MKNKSLLLAALVILLSTIFFTNGYAHARQAEIDFSALDDAIEAQMTKHDIPGVALAVIENNEITYLQGYGKAGDGSAMSAQTLMLIGSQSKSFTALAIAQLADAGKLKLGDPVQTYIPWFKVADEAASKRITIDHLLHHTSGLSDAGYGVVLPLDSTPEEAVRSLAGAELTAPVGTKHQYFNMGYSVLSYIIELVSGQSYAAYIQQHILDPLDMKSSSADPLDVATMPKGFTRVFGLPVTAKEHVPQYGVGEGYIISTAEDMAHYAMAFMQDDAAGLVSPAMVKRILTPGLGGYGMGWMIWDNGTKILHGGANSTFRTNVNIYPTRDKAFVLLGNMGYQVDHYISAVQLSNTVEALILGRTPIPTNEGWSVRWVGWGIGGIVLGLCVLHTFNFIKLRNWQKKTHGMSRARRGFDVAVSFIIPAVIMVIVFWQVSQFYGYRFNFWTNLAYLRLGLPDIFILMIVGTLPDILQGIIKIILWCTEKKNMSVNHA